jgi:hypothetical protein
LYKTRLAEPAMRALFASMAVLAVSALMSNSMAQATEPLDHRPPLSDSLGESAKEAYELGRLLLNNHDPAAALTKFQRAYDLSKDSRLLFNMAICARDMRAYARMQVFLLRYKELASDLSSDEKADIEAALSTIRRLVGAVRLEVNEPDASVALDGVTVGNTPLPAALVVDLGEHRVRVSKPGFESVEKAFETTGGSEDKLKILLVPRATAAHLTVVVEQGAMVAVDGRQIGLGPYDGKLAPGTHELRVTSPGKTPYQSSVELREGEARTLQVTLVSEVKATTWPWIAGGVAVGAGALVGGYFLLRPHEERAPGPRGSLGGLDLTFHANAR